MRYSVVVGLLSVALATAAPPSMDAPAGFDNKSNGVVDDATHQADQAKFDEVEGIDDGLWKNLSPDDFQKTRNKVRTAPLWGVRLRSRLMHDGSTVTFRDAIVRHRGEALEVRERFERLSPGDQERLFEFLRSL